MTNFLTGRPYTELHPNRHIVRVSGIPLHVDSLDGLISIGEEHFGALGRLGLGIPDHSWGLAPVTEALEPIRHSFIARECRDLIPGDNFLTVDVAAIAIDPIPADQFQQAVLIKRRYNSDQILTDDGIRLMDVATVFGHLAGNEQGSPGAVTEATPRFWLRDFDLAFREV